jgi:hypothetical protein
MSAIKKHKIIQQEGLPSESNAESEYENVPFVIFTLSGCEIKRKSL